MSDEDSLTARGFDILRQRFLIDHTPNTQTLINEEYTIMSNLKDLENIILQSNDFLPNLIVYDSDGEKLPIMPNDYIRTLLEYGISTTDNNEKVQLEEMLDKLNQKKLYLIWIKLSPSKKLKKNQTRIINFEYNVEQKKQKSTYISLNISASKGHGVFYVIKYPKDHHLANKIIKYEKEDKTIHNIKRKRHVDDSLYFTKTYDSVTIVATPNLEHSVSIFYNFKPRPQIITFPYVIVAFLSLSVIYMMMLDSCIDGFACYLPNDALTEDAKSLNSSQIHVGGAIIAASLILPRLITNSYIRHRMLIVYFVPIILATLMLIL